MKLTRYKRESSYSYTLGATLTYELLKTHPELIQRVFLRPNIKHGNDLEQIIAKLKQRHIEIIESTKAFNILNAKSNCLLIAEFQKPATRLDYSTDNPHIVLVNPSDAGNLGTIMRSAVGFGYQNLAIILPGVDPYDPKTIRASMGAVFHLNIQTFESFQAYQNPFTTRTYYAFMLDSAAKRLTDVNPISKNYSLIFGNEASGLPSEFATFATPIFIPQNQKIDSLNLSVAASIAMFELSTRQ